MKANVMTEDGVIINLREDVEITIDAVRVHADNALYHRDTGEIEPEGHVRITRLAPNK
jgi:lipopolysaccharide assembly outer membrane protein LptD (OstA)